MVLCTTYNEPSASSGTYRTLNSEKTLSARRIAANTISFCSPFKSGEKTKTHRFFLEKKRKTVSFFQNSINPQSALPSDGPRDSRYRRNVILNNNVRFVCLQCPEPKQQLGSAVRVHLPRAGADERKTGTDESLDSDEESAGVKITILFNYCYSRARISCREHCRTPGGHYIVHFSSNFPMFADCRVGSLFIISISFVESQQSFKNYL